MSLPAVVVVHFGDPGLTLGCLRNLAEVEAHPHAVVVVDHGPPPGLQHSLDGAHPRFTVLADFANPGFGAGCNRGARHAFGQDAEAVWFLNNDARLESPLLDHMLAHVRKHPDVVLWGTHQREKGRLLGADVQPEWFSREAAGHAVEGVEGGRTLGPAESLSGASILLSRAAWERLGPWPETQFLYYEDAAWCRRAHALGLPMVLLDAAVVHTRGSTTGRRSAFTTFYGTRNRLLLLGEGESRSRVLREGVYLLQRRFFRGQWSMLRPTWHGIKAALAGRAGRDPRY